MKRATLFMPPIVGLIFLFVGCVGRSTSKPGLFVEGVVVNVQYFGDSYRHAVVDFEDGRVADFRVLHREVPNGVVVWHKGKNHRIEYDSWGDIQRVEVIE